MITRCPSCRTAFKVVPDQLRIAAGWVRCGHCGELFDGRSHLIDEAAEPTPPVQDDAPPVFRAQDSFPSTTPPGPRRETGPWGDPSAPDVETDFQATLAMEPEEPSIAERVETERQQALQRETERQAEAARLEAEQREERARVERLELERAEAQRLEAERERALELEADRQAAQRQEAGQQAADRGRTEAPAPAPSAADDAFPTFSADADAGESLASRLAAIGPPLPDGQHNEPRFRFDPPAADDAPGMLAASPINWDVSPADPPLPHEPALARDPFMEPHRPPIDDGPSAARGTVPSFVRSPRVHPFWDSATVRALLWIALPVLIIVLAAQWVLHERDWLAARTPALAPVLDTLCAPLGCTVHPYRMLNAIAIDGSDFKAINADTFRFDLSVRNSADVAVAMPAFQLTLTDLQGQVLVRRVIQAAELDAPASLKAHGEFDATRSLHIADVAHPNAITSYRVVAFYP